MKLMILIAALVLSVGAAAACSRPVGIFVGSGVGQYVDIGTGNVLDAGAVSLTVNIASNGSATITERSKLFSKGGALTGVTYSANLTFTSSSTSCGGIVNITSGSLAGLSYYFTSAARGTKLSFIYYTAGSVLVLYNIQLDKV